MTKTARRMVLDCVASIPPQERAAHIQEFRRLATKRRNQGLHLLAELNEATAAQLEVAHRAGVSAPSAHHTRRNRMKQAEALTQKIGPRGDFYAVVADSRHKPKDFPIERSWGVDFGGYYFEDGSVLLFTEAANGTVYFQPADSVNDIPNAVGQLQEQAERGGESTPRTQAQRAIRAHARGVAINACDGWAFSLTRADTDIHVFGDGSSLHRRQGGESGAWISASREITTLTLGKMGITLADNALII